MSCVCYLEYHGKIFTFDDNYTFEEMWFIAKNVERYPKMKQDDIAAYAKLYSTIKLHGCKYDEEIMKTVEMLSV